MRLISFILPIYNEEENILKLWEELSNLKMALNQEFPGQFALEFIFVNDGSKDKSWIMLQNLHSENPGEVKVINFSRNYGHQIAVTAGQDLAEGDAIIIMDTDLQDPPLACLDLIKKWQEGFDVVYAQRRTYKTNFFKQFTAFIFYRLMAKIAQVEIPVDTGDFRLISKRVNLEMRKYKEKNRFLRGISSLVGFRSTAIQFDRSPRYKGKPGYTFQKSLRLALDGITSFSLFPIRFVSLVGSGLATVAILGGLLYILVAIFTEKNVEGWASLMFAVIFLGGVQLIMLGILGEYIGRIYTQVLDRPLYTISDKLGLE